MRSAIKRLLPEGVKRGLHGCIGWPLGQYFRYFPLRTGKKTVWKFAAPHLNWLERDVHAKTLFGSTLHVDARDLEGRFIYYFGIWEPHLTGWIRERLLPGETFIDVGANIGYYTLLAAKLGAQVVAIEAEPRTFAILEENLAANRSVNVRAANVAIWDREETLTMFVPPDFVSGASTLISSWADRWQFEGRCEVPAKPLSLVLGAEEMKTARLIKIDVEGAEWQVIAGMTAVLENGPKNLEVIIEVTQRILEAEGRSGADLLAIFERRGFFTYHIENDYGAMSYLGEDKAKRPQRIKTIPADAEQVDLIFSRIDAQSL